MPPKSVKKEQKSLWLECDKCRVKIFQSKLESHEKECGTLSPGIINETYNLISIHHSLPSEIDVKDIPATYLQRFLFIPETICNLCNFTMGCNLLIDINGKKYVRSSWTISDKHADGVFSNSEGLQIPQ